VKLRELATVQLGLQDAYHGEHTAPGKDAIPLYDLTVNMPHDVYRTLREYIAPGVTSSVIQSCKGRPGCRVKIYRAVPYTLTRYEQIALYERHMKRIQRTGSLPANADWSGLNVSAYYNFAHAQVEKLSALPPSVNNKLSINPGDWVSIDKQYAIEHGRSNLRNRYKVLSKTVPARELFTDGDLEEWGWSP
jgi:hypothetical protein